MVYANTLSLLLFFSLASVASFAQTLQPYSGNIFGAQDQLPYAGFVDDSKFSQIDVVRGPLTFTTNLLWERCITMVLTKFPTCHSGSISLKVNLRS